MTTLIPTVLSPNSNQQVLVKMPLMGMFAPLGFWSGMAIAIGGSVVPLLLVPKEDEPEYLYQVPCAPTVALPETNLATVAAPLPLQMPEVKIPVAVQRQPELELVEQDYQQPLVKSRPGDALIPVAPLALEDLEDSDDFEEFDLEDSYEDDPENSSEDCESSSPPISISPIAPTISYTHRSTPATKETRTMKFEEPDICEAIAASNKSVVLCSPPGTGKTSTVKAVLAEIFKRDPNAEIKIVDRKNGRGAQSGRWMGLEKIPGVVVVPTEKDLSPLVLAVQYIAGIVEKRRQLSVEQLKAQHDVWLVVDDYLAQYVMFPLLLEKEQIRQLTASLYSIAFDGRELKVRFILITHSPNCDEIGFSGGSKQSLAFFVQGYLDRTVEKRADGGFGAISAALAVNSIFPNPATRKSLMETFVPVCQEAVRCDRPAFLTTMGTPRLGIMPDLRWTKEYQLPIQFPEPVIKEEVEEDDPWTT
jgi:DNA polymerase III delta prime subunit